MDDTRLFNTPIHQDLEITRVFDAPRDLVWRAFTDCESLVQWWGPKNFTAPYCKIDLRVGGESFTAMRDEEGKDYWGKGLYREVVPNELIVVTDSFADDQGKIVPASYYGMSEDFPLEMLITLKFEDENGRTKLTLIHSGLPESELEMCRQGWQESFDKLDQYLARETEIRRAA
jgi:uncharacterized protein YndB with AHSA1/START domain